MANVFSHVSYADTGYFSHLVTDYISNSESIQPFYTYYPDEQGLANAIAGRAIYPVNRKTLVDALYRQYASLPPYEKVAANIESLQNENTFTVCTAHQPNLLTGYLYFIYKILHAIKLAEDLNAKYTDKHFVPVYYMGSEDNDIEELGAFRFRGEKFVWDGGGQAGAVGRMDTGSLKPLLQELFRLFGPPGSNCEDLQKILTDAYLGHGNIADATQYLVHELFGRYGLVVLNPDDAALKASFIPVMEDELLHQHALPVITAQVQRLGGHYKIQAHPREINLFYLDTQLRERIEKHGDKWVVLNTDIQWTQEQMLDELRSHPERFSPNVMLRGMYQETILPNVAFIGGGAEVAYWMQLKTLFDHYKVFYPAIILRQSVLWINAHSSKNVSQLGLSIAGIFKPEDALAREYVMAHSTDDWQTTQESEQITQILQSLQQKASKVDATLGPSAEAAIARIKYRIAALEQKMLRAEKKKMEVQLSRIGKLKNVLFPNNSLQERVENFAGYYLEYGPRFMDVVKEGIRPLAHQFLVVEDV